VHIFDNDAAPWKIGAESHGTDGIDDARLGAIDNGVRNDFIAQSDGEFGKSAGG
jgi:hypothetical protein